jgi:hypothetical protein
VPRARRRAAAALVALALLSGWFSPAYAARSSSKAFWGPTTVAGKSAFPMYHNLGVGIFETQLDWAQVATRRPRHPRNPNDPAYVWPPEISYAIAHAAPYRIRILLQAIHTPAWANGGRAPNWAPSRTGDFADFLTAAARRYRSVHLWMIWGEPTRQPNFQPLTPAPPGEPLNRKQAIAPHRYARMLDAGYGALKHVSRHNVVIGGNTYTAGDIRTPEWIHNLRLPNGKPPRMDLYGHNPFSGRDPNLSNRQSPNGVVDFSDLARLSKLVDRELAPRHHHLRLFLSEWTIPTSPGDIHFDFWTTPKVQAKWIQDAWRIVRRHRFIYALGWINLFDDPPGTGSRGGLLDDQGRPKPGYYAFKAG